MLSRPAVPPPTDTLSSSCLGSEQALSFVCNARSGSDPEAVRAHIDGCAPCRVLVAEAAAAIAGAAHGGAGSVRALSAGERILDRYEIRRYIACGGMGEVYEALDTVLGDRVAVKTLLPTALDDQASIKRFLDEVRLARKVSHPNVCRILELGLHRRGGSEEAIPFLTMEFLEGETLAGRLRRVGSLDPPAARRILSEILAGLGAVHAAGIVHRDLKSENVFLVADPGGGERAVVMDFGLARPLSSDVATTLQSGSSAGGVVGTPDYMAPEQVEGKPATPAFDIYAAGVIAFEMLTGRKPFAADTPLARAVMRLRQRAPAPSSLRPALSGAWDALVGRCLERAPSRRFPDVQHLAAALEALPRRTGPAAGRLRVLALGLALLAALALAGMGLGRYLRRPALALPPTAVLRYTFENSLQGWLDLRYEYYKAARIKVRPSDARAWEGAQSMEIRLSTTSHYTTPTIGVYEQFRERLPAGTVISFHVWFPRAEALTGIQPYVLYHRGEAPEPRWGSDEDIIPIARLRAGQWNEVKLRVPDDVGPEGVIEVGIEWRTNGAQTETVYLDGVSW